MSHANATPHVAPLYDYIIAGAGGAGLSLLHYLLDSPILSNKQILVIDQSLNKTNDRTWCFGKLVIMNLSPWCSIVGMPFRSMRNPFQKNCPHPLFHTK